MCSRSFFDLDGHGWQVMWMDPAATLQGPEEFAASMQDRTPTPWPDQTPAGPAPPAALPKQRGSRP